VSRQVVYEVTQPYHASGTVVLYAPGQQFPLDADLPPDVRVAEVIAEVPDEPVKAVKPAAVAVKPAARKL
jgi:hypothetical protein